MNKNFSNKDIDTLARTIYGEARGDFYKYGIASFIAIANVVLNRYKKQFADSIHSVCTAPYQFSCWNKKDPNYSKCLSVNDNDILFQKCLIVAENVLHEKWPDLTDGCEHYHAYYIRPFWAALESPKRIIGSHHFYNLRSN